MGCVRGLRWGAYWLHEWAQSSHVGCVRGFRGSYGVVEEVHGEHMGCVSGFRGVIWGV